MITAVGRPRPRARSTARPMICWWPRWTPSKTPMVTTQRPQPGGPRRARASAARAQPARPARRRGDQAGRAPAVAVLDQGEQLPVRGRTPRPGPARPVGAQPARRGRGRAASSAVELAARERPATASSRAARRRRRAPPRPPVVDRRACARPNGPDPGAAQRRQVPADAERGAEVAGQRPDVGAGRAVDDDVEVVAPPVGELEAGPPRTRRAARATSSPARTRA